jgi:Skp family chaperone for outer membrane proteins
MKRGVCVFILLAGVVLSLSAQKSITRFAVVDMNKILKEVVPNTKTLSDRQTKFDIDRVNFEENSKKLVTDAQKLNEDLESLKTQLSEAQEASEKSSVVRGIENQIKAKEQEMRNFFENGRNALNKEAERLERERKSLEDERQKLITSEVRQQIYKNIQDVAGREGFSMVLDKDTPGVMWYSGETDITNLVITRIRGGGR